MGVHKQPQEGKFKASSKQRLGSYRQQCTSLHFFFFFLHPGTNILRQREPFLRCPKMCWVQILLKSLTFLRSAAKLPEALVQLQLCTQPLKQQKSTAPGEVLTFPEAGILLFAQKRVKKKKKKKSVILASKNKHWARCGRKRWEQACMV